MNDDNDVPTRRLNERIRRNLETCKHFNGVQNEVCKAGVNYVNVYPSTGPRYRLPCLGHETGVTCSKRELLTPEEARAEAVEVESEIVAYLGKIQAGKCPECGASIEPSRKVGRCKYASCGHRIGQVG